MAKKFILLFGQVVVISLAVLFSHSVYVRFNANDAPSYRDAVGRALPSVVSIHGSRGGDSITGTGVIISDDGHILTNYHLIIGVEQVRVRLANATEYNGELLGISPDIDIAVLKVKAKNLPEINANVDEVVAPGDVVFAIGNPFGLNNSASMGIVSAIGRSRLGLYHSESFIQTDAAINPGSSGGPLTNVNGEMVGINSALYYRQHGVLPQGIGFAIPAGLVIEAYEDIISTTPQAGNVWGVSVRRVSERLRQEILLIEEITDEAFLIIKVWEGSLGQQSGLQVGDILLSIDGQPVGQTDDSGVLPRDAQEIVVLRNGQRLNINLPTVS